MKKEWLQEMKRFCEEESGVGVGGTYAAGL